MIELGFWGGMFLTLIMGGMIFVGLHINKPFPWEHKIFDKSKIKYRDGDNT
jgi:hypothetical protein